MYKIIINILNIYKNKNNLISDIENEIYSITSDKEILYELKGVSYNRLPKSNNVTDISDKIVKLIDIYDKRIQDLKQNIREIEEKFVIAKLLINNLADIEKTIILLRYCENYRWHKISTYVNLSERQCQRIKNNSFKKMYKHYNNIKK